MTSEEQKLTAADLPAAEGEHAGAGDMRVERILEHVDCSLKLNDALQASVGAATGDLMLMQYRLRQLLDVTLQQTPDSLALLAEVMPALNSFMKVGQQVDRFIQLSLKIKTANSAVSAASEERISGPTRTDNSCFIGPL